MATTRKQRLDVGKAIPEASSPLSEDSPNYSEMTRDQLIAEIMN